MSGRFDYGRARKPYKVNGKAGDLTQAPAAPEKPVRMTGRYGDNAMQGDAGVKGDKALAVSSYADNPLTEADTDLVERLARLLNKADVTSEQILSGVKLSDSGMQKVAATLGLSREETDLLFRSLVTKLRDERGRLEEMHEDFKSFMSGMLPGKTPAAAATAVRPSAPATPRLIAAQDATPPRRQPPAPVIGTRDVPRQPQRQRPPVYDPIDLDAEDPFPLPSKATTKPSTQAVAPQDDAATRSRWSLIAPVPDESRHLAARRRAFGRAPTTESVDDAPTPARYSFEADFLGNVVLRDAVTGAESMLRGSRAHRLLAELEAVEAQPQRMQRVMARFMPDGELVENDGSHAATLEKTGFWGAQAAGCIMMARTTGRVLIAHRSRSVQEPGTWGSWGGAIDSGEDPMEAVRREVAEEAGAGIEIEAIRPLYVFSKGSFSYYNFLVLVPDEFAPELNWETQGYQWCEVGHWPSPLHFGLKSLFADGPSMSVIKREAAASGAEVVEEDLETDQGDDFDDELAQAAGTFNFPWKVGSQAGFGTAQYDASGPKSIQVMSLRDQHGNPVDDIDEDAVVDQARAFVPKA